MASEGKVAIAPPPAPPLTPSSTRHPLRYKWVWSYKPTIVYKQQSADDWMADYRQLTPTSFDTVEDFWAIFNHLHPLNSLDFGNIYSVFREGILPVWEHAANEKGYSIVVYVNKANAPEYISRIYELSLLTLIGNNLQCSSIINGCTFERKSGGNKIVFWMGDTPETHTARKQQMVQVLSSMGAQQQEVTFCDANERIDWKDQKFVSFKLAVACKSHRVRVQETTQPNYNSSTSSAAPPQQRNAVGGGSGGGGSAVRPTQPNSTKDSRSTNRNPSGTASSSSSSSSSSYSKQRNYPPRKPQ